MSSIGRRQGATKEVCDSFAVDVFLWRYLPWEIGLVDVHIVFQEHQVLLINEEVEHIYLPVRRSKGSLVKVISRCV